MSEAATNPSPALNTYGKWRPRLKRGVTWAATAGALSKVMGGNAEGVKHIVVPTITAGLAGVADATLEEKLRASQNPKLQKVVERAFDEKHLEKRADGPVVDPSLFSPEVVDRATGNATGHLVELFANKKHVSELAQKQLGELFPGHNAQRGYGSSVRLSAGTGSLRSMLDAARR